jgi:hypothetical protein
MDRQVFENNLGELQQIAVIAFLIAFAGHTRSACAAYLIMPSFIRLVFAHPTDAEADGTVSIHSKNARAPLQRSRAYRASGAFTNTLESILDFETRSNGQGRQLCHVEIWGV